MCSYIFLYFDDLRQERCILIKKKEKIPSLYPKSWKVKGTFSHLTSQLVAYSFKNYV